MSFLDDLPSVPPAINDAADKQALKALRNIMSVLLGRGRSDKLRTIVTWRDLVTLGLVTEAQARSITGPDNAVGNTGS